MGTRTVAWFVTISTQPCTKMLEADASPENTVEVARYLAWSSSPGHAIAKAMKQYERDFRDGTVLRLGQGRLHTAIERTHKQEVRKWQGRQLR